MNPTTVSSRDVAWVLMRIAIGATVAYQGYGVLFGGAAGGIDGLVALLEAAGVPYPSASAWFASSVGLVCGSQLLLGLFARTASFCVLAVAVVAGIFPAAGADALAPLLFAILAGAFLVGGAGPVSFDAAKRTRREKASLSIFR
ncbi:MAG TPA: DoxX family protein [Vulgatibacter sp.]|nr:DoxX family protein [Vulgatibacter sp.]